MSDTTLKYPLWQNHYLQAMAETRPELLKSRISAARAGRQPATQAIGKHHSDYEEQIALAAALKSLSILKERKGDRANDSLSRYAIMALHSDKAGGCFRKARAF